jgi:hypothetical protein
MSVTSEIVIKAFEKAGGDPSVAIRAAKSCSSVEEWVNRQANGAALGGLGYIIPGLHIVGMVGDVANLLRRMAFCVWGVGALRGCSVQGMADLETVLGLWSGAISSEELSDQMVTAAQAGLVTFDRGTPRADDALAKFLVGEGASAGGKIVGGKGAIKMSAKIAAKVAAKIAGKAVGVVPILGAAANGKLNHMLVTSLGQSADIYWSALSSLQVGTESQARHVA